VTGGNLELK